MLKVRIEVSDPETSPRGDVTELDLPITPEDVRKLLEEKGLSDDYVDRLLDLIRQVFTCSRELVTWLRTRPATDGQPPKPASGQSPEPSQGTYDDCTRSEYDELRGLFRGSVSLTDSFIQLLQELLATKGAQLTGVVIKVIRQWNGGGDPKPRLP